jgi:hypothetical protein
MVLKKTDNIKCNEDIERERKKCSFDPFELTHLLDGGPEKTKEKKERGKWVMFLKCLESGCANGCSE